MMIEDKNDSEEFDVWELLHSGEIERYLGKRDAIKISKGTYIYNEGDPSDHIYFLNDGQIKLGNQMSDNKQITKKILAKGAVFGDSAIVDDSERREFALAMEESTYFKLSKTDVESLIERTEHGSLYFMKIMTGHIRDMEERLESLVFNDSRSRIIHYLLLMVERTGERVGYEFVVRNFIPHKEIANITATSRQTVTTVLNELRNKEIITFNRKRLLVRDIDRLRGEMK